MGRRQMLIPGTIYSVPLQNDQFGFCLLAAVKQEPLEAGFVRVFSNVALSEQSQDKNALAIAELFCTIDLMKSEIWKPICVIEVPLSMLEKFRLFTSHSILPCTIYGSRNVAGLIEAFNGLRRWDEMADPNYYAGMLLDGVAVSGSVM
jgi:hypothetical protein